MSDRATEDYIKELETDAEMFKDAAEAYEMLSQHGAEISVLGFTRTKASHMASLYRQREKYLRDFIDELKKG